MPSEGAAKPTPRKRAKPSLWALRSPISTVAGRTASLVSLAVLLAAWCVLTYVQVERNGVMEPARLFESPYTDHAPTGPDYFFPDADVDVIVDTLHRIRRTAVPGVVA